MKIHRTSGMPHRRDFVLALPALVAVPALLSQGATMPAGAPLEGLVEEFDRDLPDLQGLVGLQRGEPLLSFYRGGTTVSDLRDIQSCTKSVLSLLVGVAVGRGAIPSLEEPVLTLLRDKVEAARASQPALTVRHLLTMTSGFERLGRISRRQSDDPQFLMSRPVRAPAGTSFLYDNLSATLLSATLEAAVKMPAADFAREALFTPLGISHFEWQKGLNGHNYGSEGLRLTTQDMAKIGHLAMGQGRWGGREVVPDQYVREATRKQVPGGPPVNAPYGFMWWISEVQGGIHAFYASGFGGQLIWIYPRLDLVVATSAPVGPDFNARGHAFAAIRRLVARLQAAPQK